MSKKEYVVNIGNLKVSGPAEEILEISNVYEHAAKDYHNSQAVLLKSVIPGGDELGKVLKEKQLRLEKIGSIAEASIVVNGVFEAAQAAADQYVLNVKRICDEKAQQLLESEDIVHKARTEARRIREETEGRCKEMIRQAKEESDRYWRMVHNSAGIQVNTESGKPTTEQT